MSECSQILLGPSFPLLLVIMLVFVIADAFFSQLHSEHANSETFCERTPSLH